MKDKNEYLVNTLLNWGEQNYDLFPWRFTTNKWHALVAEIMLQRTKAEQVVPVYCKFVSKYETPKQYLDDSKAQVFKSLGLIWREKYLKELANILTKEGLPAEKKALLSLPGVGQYIASAKRTFHLGIPDTIIDSNVVRLYGRYYGFKTNSETRRKRNFLLLAQTLTPERNHKNYNYALIDFTRKICKVNPLCKRCPLLHECEYGKLYKLLE
ncbi:A/G-specific DNA-adenine glycosylase [Cytobacillus oceanisediminis]|uniref:A/G-specific DNA-adenine glycosylase n=1 Tax=Cytobacillus oceanisediminis TaxID=665099 RepID=A0A2V3A809_9BACI|nr:DNA glycosylase [Cytobacillus oceanisediminis]PWW32311.1 A/G-specific DNA-adenine glycosylase [Cytobacillus oceanisediminis]